MSLELLPSQIVEELDRYIVGQDDAKRAVAIALRNRWRRKNVPEDLQDEIVPKNILMVGPTGCGKTEISRRLARLAQAPFIKVEATKFTEVGYVGRDVDSIIRDLIETAIIMTKEQLRKEVEEKAKIRAVERILNALVGDEAGNETRDKFREMLFEGKLDDKEVEIDVQDNPSAAMPTFDIPGMPGGQMGVMNVGDILGKVMGSERTKKKTLTVKEAFDVTIQEEGDKMIDEDKIIKTALACVENEGIVFIDELDKVTARQDARGGEVSREGVQRDLLPLLEGTTISTKYGPVKTDHILFIASGAFHLAKPSDLLPELQGRFPIRVKLDALSENDLVRILQEPKANLLEQYTALLKTEGVTLKFVASSAKTIAKIATSINKEVENIGARRLHTIIEKLLEEISYAASDHKGETITVDDNYVETHLDGLTTELDLSKFIL